MLHPWPSAVVWSCLVVLTVAVSACDCGAGETVGRRGDGGRIADDQGLGDANADPDSGDADVDGGPSTELCNGVDDDGDGRVDEGCGCSVGVEQSCYPGPAALAGVGVCLLGRQMCLDTGTEEP